MPPTQRGVYHNLKESIYTISNTEIVFFFSSELYRQKFINSYVEHRVGFMDRLSKITSENPLNMNTFADICLYIDIEKRGFRAWLKGIDITCDEIYKYALRKMTEKNTLDWLIMQKPKLEERHRIME